MRRILFYVRLDLTHLSQTPAISPQSPFHFEAVYVAWRHALSTSSEAYIFTALFGKGLCSSVHSTFAFLGANAARVIVLSGIGNAIVFVAKLFVVSKDRHEHLCRGLYTQSLLGNCV